MSVITKDLGIASAYGYAKSKGYTGTEEEFAELMASYADVAQQAEAAAQDAEDAKDAAVSAKNDAQTAKTAAESAQTAAAGSAQTASTKASEASNSAQTAAGSATSASDSATAAAGSASTAQTAAQTATSKASEASSSASAASTAKTGAETARTGAQTAQTAAETAQANAEAAASSVSASATQIEQNTEEIGAIKNDLSEKADKSEALSAYIVETETGAIASFSDGADDVPVKDLSVAIEPVQSGSGDPSPENIRPISGWTKANISAVGKNLLHLGNALSSSTKNGVTITVNDDNTITFNGTANADTGVVLDFAEAGNTPVKLPMQETDYTVTCSYVIDGTVTGNYTVLCGWIDATNHQWNIPDTTKKKTITLPKNAKQLRTWIEIKSGTSFTNATFKIQYEFGSTATEFEPFRGETYEINWQSSAGTVYGGTLDVTAGVLTVDTTRYKFTGSEAYTQLSGSVAIKTGLVLKSTGNGYCTDFEFNGTGSTNFIYLKTTLTAEELKTYMGNHDVYAVVVLAQAQTYQLTAHEVSTILGQNSIFADCGSVNVQYRADTKLYIDKVLSQA